MTYRVDIHINRKELFVLQKYRVFFQDHTCLKRNIFSYKFSTFGGCNLFLNFEKLKKNTPIFFWELTSASFTTNMNLVSQKLWALVSLEALKLLHFRIAVFLQTYCQRNLSSWPYSYFFLYHLSDWIKIYVHM